jgi:hypothetical protein
MFEHPVRVSGLALLLYLLALCATDAQETEPNANQLLFVPPPIQGVISLGVYDSNSRLVRVLKRAAQIDSFKAAADGLIIDWDRTDGNDKPLPNGKYFARGVMVGDVAIEGVAFHLNDWVDSRSDPRIRKILSATLLASLRPVVIAEVPQSEVAIFEASGKQVNAILLPFNPTTVKTTGSSILVFDSNQWMLIDPSSGTSLSRQNTPDIRDADVSGNRIVLLTGNQIEYLVGSTPQGLKSPAEDLYRCAALGSSIIVASKSGKVWKLNGQGFVPIDLEETGELLDMTGGASDTVWLLVKTAQITVLKQIDSSGKSLREIELPPELQTATRLGAARDSDALMLISENGQTQRVIGIRFQSATQAKSIWEKWFDRSLTSFRFFDLKEGKIVESDTRVESPPVFVKPANDPMENTRQPPFQLSVVADDTGAWVTDTDGLPLLQVCTTKNIKQTRCISDGANGLRVYVSDGIVVEEYHLANMANLFRFDAGSFD